MRLDHTAHPLTVHSARALLDEVREGQSAEPTRRISDALRLTGDLPGVSLTPEQCAAVDETAGVDNELNLGPAS